MRPTVCHRTPFAGPRAALAAAFIAVVGMASVAPPAAAEGIDAPGLTRPVYRVAEQPPTAAAATQPTGAPSIGVQAIGTQQAPAQPAATQPFPAGPTQAAFGQPSQPQQTVADAGDAATLDAMVRPASAEAAAGPFDLAQRPGEHPLMPCLRLAKEALVDIDNRISDYECTFTKVERFRPEGMFGKDASGYLAKPQKIRLRVRHEPFSVHMKFLAPNAGQEVLYVENQNKGKLVALGAGWKRTFGKQMLDPTSRLAMHEQRYPITMAGIRNLTAELVEIAEQDVQYGECTVRHTPAKIAGRQATMIESIHPVPRSSFRYHKAQIFLDHELRLPVAYRAYSWPAESGGEPVLEEQYIYTDIKLNVGFTDEDFSQDNPELFR
ncbi:MAG: DUF1571 domain-containing protein [Planctomycetota bacterium]